MQLVAFPSLELGRELFPLDIVELQVTPIFPAWDLQRSRDPARLLFLCQPRLESFAVLGKHKRQQIVPRLGFNKVVDIPGHAHLAENYIDLAIFRGGGRDLFRCLLERHQHLPGAMHGASRHLVMYMLFCPRALISVIAKDILSGSIGNPDCAKPVFEAGGGLMWKGFLI